MRHRSASSIEFFCQIISALGDNVNELFAALLDLAIAVILHGADSIAKPQLQFSPSDMVEIQRCDC